MARRTVSHGNYRVELADDDGPIPSDAATMWDDQGNPMHLAGERITIEDADDGATTIRFDDKGTGRVCGACQLCCKLMPVPDFGKGANERCKHQRTGKGCMIYAKRPWSCRTFVCRWLGDPKATALPRPDRAHYVIDPEFDKVILEGSTVVAVMQVWLDPAFPNAWDTPELRDYMLMFAERFRAATIIRTNATDGFVVFPPPLATDGEWHIQRRSSPVTREELNRKVDAMGSKA
jgi:hypothetical protein